MWLFEVRNKITGELDSIMGYNLKDACRRKGWNHEDYVVLDQSYED